MTVSGGSRSVDPKGHRSRLTFRRDDGSEKLRTCYRSQHNVAQGLWTEGIHRTISSVDGAGETDEALAHRVHHEMNIHRVRHTVLIFQVSANSGSKPVILITEA